MQQRPTASETEDNNSIDFEPFKEANKMSIDEYLNHLLNDYDEDGNVKIKPSYGAIKEEDWIKKANAGNEEAMNFIFDHPKDYQEIITEWANNGIMKAVKSVYNNPHDFTDLIAKWAKEGDSEAADIVKNNPEIFQ